MGVPTVPIRATIQVFVCVLAVCAVRASIAPARTCTFSALHLATALQPSWRRGDVLDMHTHVFRMQHGLGGSYTSLAKRRDEYKRIADAICDDLDPDGSLCLLCGTEPGTRWHALLRCNLAEPGCAEHLSPIRHAMFQYAESSLAAEDILLEDRPLEDGSTEKTYRRPHDRECPQSSLHATYPLLHACGWLLPTLTHQGLPAEDLDLASRCVLPRCLATTLAKGPRVTGAPVPAARRALVPWSERKAARAAARLDSAAAPSA